jgi:hypothetical protein
MVEPLMKAFAFQTIFNMKQVQLRLFPTLENMDRCVLACGNVINQMQLLADNGQLQYLHDVGSLMLSNVGMALHKVFPELRFCGYSADLSGLRHQHRTTGFLPRPQWNP